jgi:DnaJ-class molecular chaperone
MTDTPASIQCHRCAGHGSLYQCQVSNPCTTTYWASFRTFPDGPPPPHVFGEYQPCESCQGNGHLGTDSYYHRCKRCNGIGSVYHVTDTTPYVVVSCPLCEGTGCLPEEPKQGTQVSG